MKLAKEKMREYMKAKRNKERSSSAIYYENSYEAILSKHPELYKKYVTSKKSY